MNFISLTLFIISVITVHAFHKEVKPAVGCGKEVKICELDPWVLERRHSMIFYKGTDSHPVVWRNNGFKIKPKHCTTGSDENLHVISDEDLQTVLTVDGTYRYLETINGQYPGPTVVAYVGQEIVVNVTNNLIQEGTGIHWHGIVQHGTNYMDGITGITQCPITMGQTFTYKFKVIIPGTFWYHSHTGMQRSDGVYGALIGLPHTPDENPTFEKDFLLMTTDFFPYDSHLMYSSLRDGLSSYLYDQYNGTQCMAQGAGAFGFHSALINGKGYLYDNNGEPTVHVPLETYEVTKGKYYKFRLFNTGMTYAFKISIDKHPLVVVATESLPITPHTTDSIIVHLAERYEFYIHANQPIGNYWIRAETLEVDKHHKTVAILKYTGANLQQPTTETKKCTAGNICQVVNCPFENYPEKYYSNCTNVNELTADSVPFDVNNFEEHFLLFGFTHSDASKSLDASINGIHFALPQAPPVAWGADTYDGKCTNNRDVCTHQINIKYGNTAQMVLLSNGVHPIHLHGFDFQVIKIVYPQNGESFPGIQCDKSTNICSWKNNGDGKNLKNINMRPVLKDTVMIPAGGYVVIRINATNPGWWLMHCHIEPHLMEGMAVIVKVGNDDQMYPPPKNLSKCGSFIETQVYETEISMADAEKSGCSAVAYGYIAVIPLMFIIGFIAGILVFKFRQGTDSARTPEELTRMHEST